MIGTQTPRIPRGLSLFCGAETAVGIIGHNSALDRGHGTPCCGVVMSALASWMRIGGSKLFEGDAPTLVLDGGRLSQEEEGASCNNGDTKDDQSDSHRRITVVALLFRQAGRLVVLRKRSVPCLRIG